MEKHMSTEKKQVAASTAAPPNTEFSKRFGFLLEEFDATCGSYALAGWWLPKWMLAARTRRSTLKLFLVLQSNDGRNIQHNVVSRLCTVAR